VEEVVVRVVVVVAVVESVPEHATPLTVKPPGTLLVVPDVPWNPKDTVPFVATELFQETLDAVTVDPLWVTVAFHAEVTACPSANDHDIVQPFSGSPTLVSATFATNPPGHWDVTA